MNRGTSLSFELRRSNSECYWDPFVLVRVPKRRFRYLPRYLGTYAEYPDPVREPGDVLELLNTYLGKSAARCDHNISKKGERMAEAISKFHLSLTLTPTDLCMGDGGRTVDGPIISDDDIAANLPLAGEFYSWSSY